MSLPTPIGLGTFPPHEGAKDPVTWLNAILTMAISQQVSAVAFFCDHNKPIICAESRDTKKTVDQQPYFRHPLAIDTQPALEKELAQRMNIFWRKDWPRLIPSPEKANASYGSFTHNGVDISVRSVVRNRRPELQLDFTYPLDAA